MASPVAWCRAKLPKTSGTKAQFSFTWLGNSTKSVLVAVPLKVGYFWALSMPCSAWPNSWNSVVTSSQLSRHGCPSAGLTKLQTWVITGCWPSRVFWSTKLLIQAPPFLLSRA